MTRARGFLALVGLLVGGATGIASCGADNGGAGAGGGTGVPAGPPVLEEEYATRSAFLEARAKRECAVQAQCCGEYDQVLAASCERSHFDSSVLPELWKYEASAGAACLASITREGCGSSKDFASFRTDCLGIYRTADYGRKELGQSCSVNSDCVPASGARVECRQVGGAGADLCSGFRFVPLGGRCGEPASLAVLGLVCDVGLTCRDEQCVPRGEPGEACEHLSFKPCVALSQCRDGVCTEKAVLRGAGDSCGGNDVCGRAAQCRGECAGGGPECRGTCEPVQLPGCSLASAGAAGAGGAR